MFFKYSLVKRKKDAFVNNKKGAKNLEDDDNCLPDDLEASKENGFDFLDAGDNESSSYNRDNHRSRRKPKQSKRRNKRVRKAAYK